MKYVDLMIVKQGVDNMTYQDTEDTYDENTVSTDIVSLHDKEILSCNSYLTSITKKGLTFHTDKKGLLVHEKDFSKFLNHPVELFLSQYELPFYGVIKNIVPLDKDIMEIYIGFMENTPLYYRECIEELLN